MIDFHTHTVFSDGELIPSELVRRAKVAGYEGIAITDHGDFSNIDLIIPRIVKVAERLNRSWDIRVLPGIELTHMPPDQIAEAAKESRRLGAKIIVVHGETLAEPVCEGTNQAALETDIDILAHPGLLTLKQARLAAAREIFLEISTRKGHSLTNGHVVKVALEAGAMLLINNDAHAPGDLVTREKAEKILIGCGLDKAKVHWVFENARMLLKKKVGQEG